eukprot:CAMPEP_0172858778 /NCGR_PEP_ID=MMETSP1075-20121228/67903_1 /TAXON_ID=2916 /ORGANISM="Ceratium fusus, Strain PA161109" /LENGTH=52 /DNA_ID=CAMNT_0013706407 /DNA_START=156 /DNA_END=311 /DNA_ORIENTATION=-
MMLPKQKSANCTLCNNKANLAVPGRSLPAWPVNAGAVGSDVIGNGKNWHDNW